MNEEIDYKMVEGSYLVLEGYKWYVIYRDVDGAWKSDIVLREDNSRNHI